MKIHAFPKKMNEKNALLMKINVSVMPPKKQGGSGKKPTKNGESKQEPKSNGQSKTQDTEKCTAGASSTGKSLHT